MLPKELKGEIAGCQIQNSLKNIHLYRKFEYNVPYKLDDIEKVNYDKFVLGLSLLFYKSKLLFNV